MHMRICTCMLDMVPRAFRTLDPKQDASVPASSTYRLPRGDAIPLRVRLYSMLCVGACKCEQRACLINLKHVREIQQIYFCVWNLRKILYTHRKALYCLEVFGLIKAVIG